MVVTNYELAGLFLIVFFFAVLAGIFIGKWDNQRRVAKLLKQENENTREVLRELLRLTSKYKSERNFLMHLVGRNVNTYPKFDVLK